MDNRTKLIRCVAAAVLVLAFALSVFVLSVNRYGFSVGGAEQSEAETEKTEASDDISGWVWRYMDAGGTPGNGNVWTTEHYRADAWNAAAGPFYTSPEGKRSGTTLTAADGNGSFAPTYFFRTEFSVEDAGAVRQLNATVRYSDAVLVYLNGEIIFAGNVPPGGYAANLETGCSEASGTVEEKFCVTDLSALRSGTNILAVELHQEDPAAGRAYFDMPRLSLLEEETEEAAPEIDGAFLELGGSEEQVYANFLSKDAESWEVGYITESALKAYEDAEGDLDPFALGATYVLLGRTYDESRQCYVYRAPLSLLQKSETYLYRVRRVGGRTESETRQFDFSASLSYAFAVIRSGFSGDGAEEALEAAETAADGLGGTLRFYAADRAFADGIPDRSGSLPGCTLDSAGNYSFTYHDVLFLVLSPDEGDPEKREAFIRAERERIRRHWTVVLLNEPWTDAAENPYGALGVDLTVNAAAQDILLVQVTDSGLRTTLVEP